MELRISPTKANVLLAWELGGGLGHCVKLAPLAACLVERGHQVYFAARDVATAQRVLQNPAVKYLQAPFLGAKPANATRQPRTFAQVLEQVGFGEEGALQSLVVAWRNMFELVRPSMIVCEHSPTALLASRWTDVRRVVIGTGFSLPPDTSPLPDLCPWMGPTAHGLAEQEFSIVGRLNQLLEADGLTPLERLPQLYADVDAAFLMTFRELDHHPNRGPAEYLGSWPLSGGIAPEWPAGDGPRVFAYLKSQGGPFRLESAIVVLRELPVQALVHIPRASKNILDMQTRSLRIYSEPVNIAGALARCDLAILNGTAGTATQCLLAGVPLLMVPLYLEQVAFSRRIVQLGAGIMSEPSRIELLGPRIWRLLQDDRYRRAARAFAERYASYDPEQAQKQMIDRVAA